MQEADSAFGDLVAFLLFAAQSNLFAGIKGKGKDNPASVKGIREAPLRIVRERDKENPPAKPRKPSKPARPTTKTPQPKSRRKQK